MTSILVKKYERGYGEDDQRTAEGNELMRHNPRDDNRHGPYTKAHGAYPYGSGQD